MYFVSARTSLGEKQGTAQHDLQVMLGGEGSMFVAGNSKPGQPLRQDSLALASSTFLLLQDPVPAFLYRLALDISEPCPMGKADSS